MQALFSHLFSVLVVFYRNLSRSCSGCFCFLSLWACAWSRLLFLFAFAVLLLSLKSLLLLDFLTSKLLCLLSCQCFGPLPGWFLFFVRVGWRSLLAPSFDVSSSLNISLGQVSWVMGVLSWLFFMRLQFLNKAFDADQVVLHAFSHLWFAVFLLQAVIVLFLYSFQKIVKLLVRLFFGQSLWCSITDFGDLLVRSILKVIDKNTGLLKDSNFGASEPFALLLARFFLLGLHELF